MAPLDLLISSFIQSILYGIYVDTLISCIRWLSYEDEGWILRKKVNWPILTVTLFLCACLTAYLSIFLQRTVCVMFDHPPTNQILLDVLTIIAGIARIITDAVLMYRCWVVHARSWRIIALPIVLWFSSVVALGLLARSYVKPYLQAMGSISPIVFMSCHIANNIYGTSAIVYKIMRVAKTRRLKTTCRILIESGILYTLSGALSLAFMADSNLHNKLPYMGCIVDTINFSMTGITFNLIILRTGQERANPRIDFVDSAFVASGLRRLSGLQEPQSQD